LASGKSIFCNQIKRKSTGTLAGLRTPSLRSLAPLGKITLAGRSSRSINSCYNLVAGSVKYSLLGSPHNINSCYNLAVRSVLPANLFPKFVKLRLWTNTLFTIPFLRCGLYFPLKKAPSEKISERAKTKKGFTLC